MHARLFVFLTILVLGACSQQEEDPFFPFSHHITYNFDANNSGWVGVTSNAVRSPLLSINVFNGNTGLEVLTEEECNCDQLLIYREISGLKPSTAYEISSEFVDQDQINLSLPVYLLTLSDSELSRLGDGTFDVNANKFSQIEKIGQLTSFSSKYEISKSVATDDTGNMTIGFLKDFQNADSVFWFIEKVSINLNRSN